MLEDEDMAIAVANSAVQHNSSQAIENVRQLFSEFSVAPAVVRLAKAWTLALIARASPGEPMFYQHVAHAIKLAPTRLLLRAMLPSIVTRAIGDKAQRSLRKLKRSLTRSPVGLSLSELC
jgi:hypothetical protein